MIIDSMCNDCHSDLTAKRVVETSAGKVSLYVYYIIQILLYVKFYLVY